MNQPPHRSGAELPNADDLVFTHAIGFAPGSSAGQYLTIERLDRISETRHHYLAGTASAKWRHRVCWACGNKYSPNNARCCTYCLAPLGDRQFRVTARWDVARFGSYQEFVRRRPRHLGLIAPVALLLKSGQMLSVYHHHGEHVLGSLPAPLSRTFLLRAAWRLADAINHLHHLRYGLERLTVDQILVMPDGTVRLFDVDPIQSPDIQAIRANTQHIGALLTPLCPIEDTDLISFFATVADGRLETPADLRDAVARLMTSEDFEEPVYAAQSEVGCVRKVNEDSWGWRSLGPEVSAYIVADGMGGHEAGDVASQLAVRVCLTELARGVRPDTFDTDPATQAVDKAFKAANTAVFAAGAESHRSMGCTLVGAIVYDMSAIIAHIGDSRAYVFRGGRLSRITKDHSLAEALIDEGKLSRRDAAKHPSASRLIRAVGMEADVEVDVQRFELYGGDRLLLCSDGLWGEVDDMRIARTLRQFADPRHAARRLVDLALAAGGHDNVTVEVVDVPGAPPPATQRRRAGARG